MSEQIGVGGRKEIVVVVPQEWGGRDAGKHFHIKELPAIRAEKWAWRAVLALKGTSGAIPADVAQYGMVEVARLALNAFLAAPIQFSEIEPLLDELLQCVQMVRDVRNAPTTYTLLMDEDIQEVRTVGWLRDEVVRLHTSFSFADALWTLASLVRTPADSQTT